MTTRGAIWARVSTEEQESGNQLAALRAEAARHGLEVVAEYVLDGLSAWTGAHREQLRRALDEARAERYEVRLTGRGGRSRTRCPRITVTAPAWPTRRISFHELRPLQSRVK